MKLRRSKNARRSMKRSRRYVRRSLRGGAASCVNDRDASGAPIDPFSLEPIPLSRLMRIPVNHNDPMTDYYCFDQTNLYEWIHDDHNTNPLTGLPFSPADAKYMRNNAKPNLLQKDGRFRQNWNAMYVALINWNMYD